MACPCIKAKHAGHSPLHGGTGRRPVLRRGSPAAAHTFLTGPGQRAACVKFPVRDRAGQCTGSCGAVVTAASRRILPSPPHAPRGEHRRRTDDRHRAPRALRPAADRRRASPAPGTGAEYLLHDHTSRPHRTLGRLPPAHPHARPPQTGLAEHRVRRKQARRAAAPMTIRLPPDRPGAIPEVAGQWS